MAQDTSRFEFSTSNWMNAETIEPTSYECGYCNNRVAPDKGYRGHHASHAIVAFIRLCPLCKGPTAFDALGRRFPSSRPGRPVSNVPDDLTALYEEARQSVAAGAYTGAVLLCRKMLMNIAVQEGAIEGKPFVVYVQHLADKGFVPPNGRIWVDYIRKRGNEATHEIALMGEQDAIALMTFVEMLLRFIYEFPNLVPPSSAVPALS